MASTNFSIKPLPVEAQLQLKSSIALNTLNDAIIGLIKNSLDAKARSIHVEVDFLRGNCFVEDDGFGIPAVEFERDGGLGLMHCEALMAWESFGIADIYRYF
jgi:DNA mismatch repair protein MLH3